MKQLKSVIFPEGAPIPGGAAERLHAYYGICASEGRMRNKNKGGNKKWEYD